MSLKGRINKLEKDNAPKRPPVKMVLDWSEATGDPVKDAEIRANRPTHNEDGEKIIYIDWADEPDIPAPTEDDETRIQWANDVLGGGGTDQAGGDDS